MIQMRLHDVEAFKEASEPFKAVCEILYGDKPMPGQEVTAYFDPADMVIDVVGGMNPELATRIFGDLLVSQSDDPGIGLVICVGITHTSIKAVHIDNDPSALFRFVADMIRMQALDLEFARAVRVMVKDDHNSELIRIRVKFRGREKDI